MKLPFFKPHSLPHLLGFATLIAALLALLCVSYIVAAGSAIRLSEPVETDQFSETFGARFVVKGETLGLKKAITESNCEENKSVTIQTKVEKVCQAKGCFFIAAEDDYYTRVSFQDYAFFVPTDISGKQVVMNATLKPRTLSDDEFKHMEDDLGSESSISHGPNCELTAQSVKVLN